MTMLAPLPSIEAFRRDAVSDGVELDDGVAAGWLESAIRLERAAMTRGAERDRLLAGLLAQHGVVKFKDSAISPTALTAAVVSVAAAMEDQAFFRLAHSVLSTLLIVLPESEVLLRGRVIAHNGRLARHIGDLRSAGSYYEEVDRLGSEQKLAELTGRAWVGYGILAQLRGDFPEARRRFRDTIALEGAASDSITHAHQQLMVAAAAAKDYDSAASHGWQAFKGSSSAGQETEALVNLAQLLLEAGYPRAALRGFAAALARKPISRLELPILGGAACAAAAALPHVAARALVRNFAERLDHLVGALHDGSSLPWPSAAALVEISEALAVVGDEERSADVAERADVLASAHGFYQLTHRLENPIQIAKPVMLAPSTTEIIAAVDELEGAELVGAAS
jgi:tetratricopeptide (TPR) repeat protein